MSEPQPSLLSHLSRTEHEIYQRVQRAINDGHDGITMVPAELDRLLDHVMLSSRRAADQEALVAELKTYADGLADMVIAMAKLLEIERKRTR